MNLYTIDCPKCKVLEKKLIGKNIDFNKVTDIEQLEHVSDITGIEQFPILENNKKYYTFTKAVELINNWSNS